MVGVTPHWQEDGGIQSNVAGCAEALSWLPNSLWIDFHSGYDHILVHDNSWDQMAFQSMQGMDWMIRLVPEATNSESAFVRISWKKLSTHLGLRKKMCFKNIQMKILNS